MQASLAWGDVDANLTRFAGRVAACEGADVIVFPELFVSGCEMRKRDAGEAIDQKERVADRFVEVRDSMILWARRSGALVVGSTIYRSEGKYYNRLLAAYPDGECLYYDKHNCFKRGSFSPGDRRVILSYKFHLLRPAFPGVEPQRWGLRRGPLHRQLARVAPRGLGAPLA